MTKKKTDGRRFNSQQKQSYIKIKFQIQGEINKLIDYRAKLAEDELKEVVNKRIVQLNKEYFRYGYRD